MRLRSINGSLSSGREGASPRRQRAAQGESGQILILAVGTMAFVLILAGLAIDVGFWSQTKREVQNDADSMALAGARSMPDEDAAYDAAMAWAGYNEVTGDEIFAIDIGETCGGDSLEGTVTARLERNQEAFLARLLGISGADLGVCATARIGVAAAGYGMLPFGLLEEDPEVADVCHYDDPDLYDQSCLLKIPKPNETWASGNTGPLRLDEGGEPGNYDPGCSPGSSGASEYGENIEDGAECYYAVDDEVRTKTGNVKGPTCSSMDSRLGENGDSLETVFGPVNADGVHYAPNTLHPRFGIVPIVYVPEGATGTSTNVTITGFIAVYIEDACHTGSCNGNGNNPACVLVKPVKAHIVMSGAAFGGGSISDDKNALRTIKLID